MVVVDLASVLKNRFVFVAALLRVLSVTDSDWLDRSPDDLSSIPGGRRDNLTAYLGAGDCSSITGNI